MKIAIIQSNYIPWKGYFDIIHDVDLFIFHDDLQYTKGDWRNRNKIKTSKGILWITIPVGTNTERLICEVEIKDKHWQHKHYNLLKQYYTKAPYYKKYIEFLNHIYMENQWDNLSEFNQYTIQMIAKELLDIKTKFEDSRIYQLNNKKQDKVIELLKKTEASTYISGPAAKSYITENSFHQAGIKLIWKDYSNYPEYPQFFPPFEHSVTILDLLFQTGPDTPYYIWGWRQENK